MIFQTTEKLRKCGKKTTHLLRSWFQSAGSDKILRNQLLLQSSNDVELSPFATENLTNGKVIYRNEATSSALKTSMPTPQVH
jgi:hypothetical protein